MYLHFLIWLLVMIADIFKCGKSFEVASLTNYFKCGSYFQVAWLTKICKPLIEQFWYRIFWNMTIILKLPDWRKFASVLIQQYFKSGSCFQFAWLTKISERLIQHMWPPVCVFAFYRTSTSVSSDELSKCFDKVIPVGN